MGIRQESARGKSSQAEEQRLESRKDGDCAWNSGVTLGKSVPWLFGAVGPPRVSPQAKPWFPQL